MWEQGTKVTNKLNKQSIQRSSRPMNYEKTQRKRAALIFDDSDSHNQNEVNIMKNFR